MQNKDSKLPLLSSFHRLDQLVMELNANGWVTADPDQLDRIEDFPTQDYFTWSDRNGTNNLLLCPSMGGKRNTRWIVAVAGEQNQICCWRKEDAHGVCSPLDLEADPLALDGEVLGSYLHAWVRSMELVA